MLHVDIHIISTINSDMDVITISHHTPIGVIHLGLVGQFHYQALKEVDIPLVIYHNITIKSVLADLCIHNDFIIHAGYTEHV